MENELLHQILSELKGIKTDVSDLKADQQEIRNDIQEIRNDIQEIRNDVQEIRNDVSGVKDDVTSLQAGQQKLAAEITGVKSQQEETLQISKAIHHRQDVSDAKLEALTISAHHLHGSLTELKEGQERQDRILASLSMRSLEQETELREIKRIK